tara:strand:- start:992 stop:1252 length:261 start_codon:yes stop_codon:yes gene_type:complete
MSYKFNTKFGNLITLPKKLSTRLNKSTKNIHNKYRNCHKGELEYNNSKFIKPKFNKGIGRLLKINKNALIKSKKIKKCIKRKILNN